MALSNYTDLKQAIVSWSKRTDVADVVDDFIDLAENRIDKTLEMISAETRVTPSASTSSRFLALPSLYKSMRKINIISGGINYKCEYVTPERLIVDPSAGRPKTFTITSQIEFDRVPDSAYSVEINYISALSALSDSNTTNAVLTAYPDLYLTACLSACAMWERDFESMAVFDSRFDEAMILANKQESSGRYGVTPTARSTSAVV